MPTQDLATQNDLLPAGMDQEQYDALIAQQEQEFSDDLFQTPILKIGQGLSKEVQAGDAEAGEFIDSIQGEGIGDKVSFIVAYYQQGRFASDKKTGRAYSAFGETIPEHWEPLVGAEWVGTLFTEHPDADEQFKIRVNNKEIEWGGGPLISTTHNYTGYAIVPAVDSDEEDELRPVRLSLKRTDMKAVRKWETFRRSLLRGKPFWDIVFDLSTEKNTYSRGAAFNLVVKTGRKTTMEEKTLAVELAQAVAAGRVVDNSEKAVDMPVAPEAKGGLGV